MDGTRILITGAATGIGRAIAERAVSGGADVILVDRVEIPASDFSPRPDRRVLPFVLDLVDLDGLPTLATFVETEFGSLDAIMHVAGVLARRETIDEVTEEDFDFQYQVNLKATFFLAVHLRRLVIDGGAIVLFASQAWWTGGLGGSLPYAATKAGVVALTRGLARELAPRGVRVNAVAPGFVDTDMMHAGLSDALREQLITQVPFKRMAMPEEVADAALMLVGSGASYITGTVLNVTGGHLIY